MGGKCELDEAADDGQLDQSAKHGKRQRDRVADAGNQPWRAQTEHACAKRKHSAGVHCEQRGRQFQLGHETPGGRKRPAYGKRTSIPALEVGTRYTRRLPSLLRAQSGTFSHVH